MPTVEIPLSLYSARERKPDHPYGAPAQVPIRNDAAVGLLRGSIDRVPLDATVTSAHVRVVSAEAKAGSASLNIRGIIGKWSAKVTWNKLPDAGGVIQTKSPSGIPKNYVYDFDVTAWVAARNRGGLRLQTADDGTPPLRLWGSSAPAHRPKLVVTYTVAPESPGNLVPDGGAVSVPQPILAFAGPAGMNGYKVEYSDDGIAASWTSPWVSSMGETGRFDPAGTGAPWLTNGGAGVYWRAYASTAGGESDPSPWAYYEYDALPAVAITSPGLTTSDGSPTAEWTASSQVAWRVDFTSGDDLVDESGWSDEEYTRAWTPDKGIGVPGVAGRFTLEVVDAITPRVAAENAPTTAVATKDFSTVLEGSGVAVTNIAATFNDPTPVITSYRSAGVPDQVALARDGVLVPIWDADGNGYKDWAPAASFYSGNVATIVDYTADLRRVHTWTIRTKAGGVESAAGPAVTHKFATGGVWILDPTTGDRVEVFGYGGSGPQVTQRTEEGAILHLPINGGALVEPKRRRLIRTTRMGSLSGAVIGTDEDLLEEWTKRPRDKFRLIFGKVNWPVILGDYDPSDDFYKAAREPNHVQMQINWWQRIRDL